MKTTVKPEDIEEYQKLFKKVLDSLAELQGFQWNKHASPREMLVVSQAINPLYDTASLLFAKDNLPRV